MPPSVPFLCEQCASTFAHRSSFYRHKRTCGKDKTETAFGCEECGRKFSRKSDLKRHKRILHSNERLYFFCGMCNTTFATRKDLEEHRESVHVIRSKFKLIQAAHNSSVQLYRLILPETVQMQHEVVSFVKPRVHVLLTYFLEELKHFKCSFILSQRFAKAQDVEAGSGEVVQGLEGQDVFTMYFRSPQFNFNQHMSDLPDKINTMFNILSDRFDDFLQNGSGYVLTESLSFDAEILECSPLGGSCELHKIIHRRQVGVQVKNVEFSPSQTDNECFYFAIAAYFLSDPDGDDPPMDKIQSFMARHIDKNVEAPVPLKLIPAFEEANSHLDIAVNVIFQAEDGSLFPARASSKLDAINIINLLLFFTDQVSEDGEPILHYALIENLPKLLSKAGISPEGVQYSHKKVLCFNCFSSFCETPRSTYLNHVKWCHQEKSQRIVTPEKGDTVTYDPKNKSTKVGYVFFFDFETLQKKPERVCSCPSSARSKCEHKTIAVSNQEAFAYSFIMVNREGKVVEKECFVGESEDETMHHFLSTLKKMDVKYSKILRTNIPMNITQEEEKMFNNADYCHICHKRLNGDDRVRDHDHLTGRYLGAAHNLCNLMRQESRRIVGYCHNFSGFDSHLIVKALPKFEEKVKLTGIPLNREKFKMLIFGNMMLCDSMSFLGSSLSSLVDTLKASNHAFPLLKEWVDGDQEKLDALNRKGVFPYEYLTCIDRVKERKLPPISAFTTTLSGQISADDYIHAQRVWDIFGCESIADYTRLYVMADTIQLAEAVLDLRNSIYDEFEVDLVHYLSLPMLSKDLMLKITGCNMELLSDIEQINMIRSGIRGGVSYVSHRYFNCEEEREKMGEDVCLNYVDANNLYGKALKMSLPLDNFQWMSEEELENIDFEAISDSAPTSCILEVDLSYPEELHYEHSSFPLAPHQLDIDETMLSPYSMNALHSLTEKKKHRAKKLTSTFLPRKNYVVHALNLKLYLKLGMKLEKIHRGISFNQSKFIAPYIEICSKKRAEAPTKSRSNLYKLLSNSLFGKLIENGSNRMEVKFIRSQEESRRNNTDPRMKSHLILGENLSIAFMKKKETLLNQSWAVGFSVLDLSKYIMQKLYYKALKPAFGNRVTTVLTDTDSFLVAVPGKNSDEALQKIASVMDFSNYPPSHHLYCLSRKNVPGYLKNETAGDEILETVGIRSKTYSIKTKKEITNKCKGVKGYVKNKIPFSAFVEAVKELCEVNVTQHSIQSKKHNISLIQSRKIAFSSFDDKRYSLCQMHTVPYNSYLIKKSQGLKNNCIFCEYPRIMV